MTTSSRLAQAFRDLATFMEPYDSLPHWNDQVWTIFQLHDNWPHLVSKPRVIGYDGPYAIYAFSVGHGKEHIIVNFPHGTELIRLTGLGDEVAFLCLNSWLLEGFTFDYVLDSPLATARNLKRWAGNRDGYSDLALLDISVREHWRLGPYEDPAWCYPICCNGQMKSHPVPGCLANMRVIDEIHSRPDVRWVGCQPSHNKHLGLGTHFQYSGPENAATAITARQLEDLAIYLELPLDGSPPEGPHLTLYPGTIATTGLDHHAPRCALGPIQVGGTIYDYALEHTEHPYGLSVEGPMFQYMRTPSRLSIGSLLNGGNRTLSIVFELLQQTAKIAGELPRTRDVLATRAYLEKQTVWGQLLGEDEAQNLLLDPADLRGRLIVQRLEIARTAGPALATYRRHRRWLEAKGKSYTQPFEALERWVTLQIGRAAHHFKLAPLHRSSALQIMASLLTAWGSRGVHLDEPL